MTLLDSNRIAEDVIREIPPGFGPQILKCDFRGRIVYVHVRRCSRYQHVYVERWNRYDTELVHSGGLNLKVRLPIPEWGDQAWEMERRLKPGWDDSEATIDKKIKRAMDTMLDKAWDELIRQSEVLRVYELVNKVIDDNNAADLQAIDKAEKTYGHTSIYSDMTLDDTAFWLGWLGRRKARNQKRKGA